MKTRDPIAALAVGAAIVTIALTAAAFWLSYEHLHDVANANGLEGERAWAWPATVDLFIVAGELLMLRAGLQGRVDPWAITLTAVGSLGSIALNVAGVGGQAQPMEYVVAAVPPAAALIAFGAIMRQVHERLAQPSTTAVEVAVERIPTAAEAAAVTGPHPQPDTAALASAPTALILDLAPMLPAPPDHCTPAAASASVADHAPDAVRELHAPSTDAQLLAAARELNATALAQTGRTASLRRLQADLGIGQRRAQRIQQHLAKGA